MNAPLTPAATALNDLIATMQAISTLYEKARRSDLSDEQDGQLSKLEDRLSSLERQLEGEVRDKLGIDYAVLWHAVTPSGPVPKLP